MYGDLQYNYGGQKFKGKTKVYQVKAHPDIYHEDFIVGFSGTASDVVSIISFFTYPEKFDKPPRVRDCTGLVLTASKQIFVFDHYTKWLAVDAKYHAIGSGSAYALGALSQGAHPKDAVKSAMKHDAYTGLGIKGFSI